MEGTNLQKEGSKADFKTERELEEELVSIFQATTGMPLVWCSGQNIDRIVTVFRAAKRSGRRLIVDMYTAEILKATGNPKIPQADWKDVSGFLPRSQRGQIKRTQNFATSNRYRLSRIFPEALAGAASQSVMLFRKSCQPHAFAREFERTELHTDNEPWEVGKMMEEPRMNKELNSLRPDTSLHKVKDLIGLRYAAEQARFILEHLDSLLEATANVAPVRQTGHGYTLNRDVPVRRLNKSPKNRDRWMEKHWEEASFLKWRGSDHGLESSVVFRRLVAYQVMLRETNEDKGWGEIDLLGMDRQSLPVVVELKSKPGETLLRAITEAVAYGVAIKKAWNAEPSQFREDWKSAVGPQVCCREKITCIHSVIAAPTFYWSTVLNPSQKRTRHQTRPEVIKVIRLLLKELSEKGHKISLVEITHEEFEDKYGLPILTGAKTVEMTERG